MQTNGDKSLSLAARLLLISAGIVSLVAGPVLFVLPTYTSVYFAWTIQNPPTPVFMGASYITAGFGLFLALLSNRWSVARTIIPAVIMFALTQLLATSLHVGIFRWGFPVAWAWLAVYVFAAPIGIVIFARAERNYVPPTFEAARVGCLLAPVMIGFCALYVLIGLALILLPEQVGAFWPWPLTPLTARVVGGWLLTVATLAWMLARQRHGQTRWAVLLSFICLSFLLVAGAVWRRAEFTGPPVSVAAYLFVTALLGGYSALTLLLNISASSGRQAAQPATTDAV